MNAAILRRMGAALPLGSVQRPTLLDEEKEKRKWLPQCASAQHRWRVSKFNRVCVQCGKWEVKQ